MDVSNEGFLLSVALVDQQLSNGEAVTGVCSNGALRCDGAMRKYCRSDDPHVVMLLLGDQRQPE